MEKYDLDALEKYSDDSLEKLRDKLGLYEINDKDLLIKTIRTIVADIRRDPDDIVRKTIERRRAEKRVCINNTDDITQEEVNQFPDSQILFLDLMGRPEKYCYIKTKLTLQSLIDQGIIFSTQVELNEEQKTQIRNALEEVNERIERTGLDEVYPYPWNMDTVNEFFGEEEQEKEEDEGKTYDIVNFIKLMREIHPQRESPLIDRWLRAQMAEREAE